MDILLGENGDAVFINGECPVTQEDVDVVAQRLTLLLNTLLGEWDYNLAYGIPYFQRILAKKNITKAGVDRIFQEKILQERGVKELVSFSSEFDNSTRNYSCKFRVRCLNNLVSEYIIIDEVI